MTKKAIIFDFDGVLLDDTKVIIEAYEEVARRLGLSTVGVAEKVKLYLGLPAKEMVEYIFGDKPEYLQTRLQLLPEYLPKMKLMPGVKEMLASLPQPKAIISGSRRETIENKLGELKIYFEIIIAQEDNLKRKPDPELVFVACQKLDVKPEEVVYIGDALLDYQIAKNAGVKFIGYVSGNLTREDFVKLGVKETANSLAELTKLLLLV